MSKYSEAKHRKEGWDKWFKQWCRGWLFYDSFFGKYKEVPQHKDTHFIRPAKHQFRYWMELAYRAGYRAAVKDLQNK